MRVSKKILSIVLAMLMLASVCVVPSVAAPLDGAEDNTMVSVKYEVTQPESIWDGTLEAVDGNLYAVTVYAKAKYGLNVLQVPLYFDADLFSPIMWQDDDPIANEAVGVEGWYENNGDATVYDFGEGEAWSDDSWYRTNGNAASSTGNARFIGLGNANVTKPIAYYANYIDSTKTDAYDAYNTVQDDNFDGYMFCFFLNNQSKTAYMNGIANAIVNDYVEMMTIYFIRNEGVTAEECIGAEFGWSEGGDWLTQAVWDTSGSPSYFASTYVEETTDVKYVSNAVVEAAVEPSILNPLKNQIKFGVNEEGASDGTFDYRMLAVITGADFTATFTDVATAKEDITEMGFVHAISDDGSVIDLATAKGVVNGTAANGYTLTTVNYLSTSISSGNYVMSLFIDNIPAADKGNTVSAIAYIKTADAIYFYPVVASAQFSGLYDTYYSQAFPA